MAKAKQAKTTTPVVETPVVETPVVETPVVEKKARKPKAEKAAAPAPVEPVAAPAVEEAVAGDVDTSLEEQSTEFQAKLQQLSSLISSLKSEFRALERKWGRELKSSRKMNSRRKRKTGNRAPSGFVKPTRINDELASFLGKEKGAEMARTAVTRDINAYIRTNNLQDTTNGRKINPDAKLASLLKLGKEDVLTYFNLQRFMSPHFSKTVKVEAGATA